jgi:hypothetical protein
MFIISDYPDNNVRKLYTSSTEGKKRENGEELGVRMRQKTNKDSLHLS